MLNDDRGMAVSIGQRYIDIREVADVVLGERVHKDRHAFDCWVWCSGNASKASRRYGFKVESFVQSEI